MKNLSSTVMTRRNMVGGMLAGASAFALAACGSNAQTDETNTTGSESGSDGTATTEETPTEVTVASLNGNNEPIEVTVPYNPSRVAVIDMAVLDILDALGVGDAVVGSARTSLDYLKAYSPSDSIANLGTIKEADVEATAACEPEVIFIGGRLAESYDTFSEIAPVVYLSTGEDGVVKSTEENATTIASIFGLEDKVAELMADYEERIDAIKQTSEGKTAIVGMVTSGGFNVLGNDARCSLIGVECGFENVGADAEADTSTHGNEASFEFIVEKNPDYIFVLDRDAAIGTEGAQLAADVLDNELVNGTDAVKNGNLVILENPAVWYTAEGGIKALDIMIADLEDALA